MALVLKDRVVVSTQSTGTGTIILSTAEQGYQGFLATNFNDPLSGKEGDVTLTFKKCNKAIVYVKGEPKTVDLKDGKLTERVGAGEGIFVVPYVG